MTHLRECSVIKYHERLHIKIPLHEVLIDKKPVIVINNKYIELIFKDKLDVSPTSI